MININQPINSKFGFFGTRAHGPVLKNKCAGTADADLLQLVEKYDHYIESALKLTFDLNDKVSLYSAIKELTSQLNFYRNSALSILEARENSGQENLRSSILEEFFQLLLFPLTDSVRSQSPKCLTLGKANSYVSLTFTPRSFSSLFEQATPTIHTKDQDFVLGCSINLSSSLVGANNTDKNLAKVVIPVVAIECKTYIERNMLDACAGTAKRLKSAMPYCLYFVAAEYMKMDEAYPELTDIDELFILTKASNADRLRYRSEVRDPHPICEDLIQVIFEMIATHLKKIWWSPEDALARGRVIGRP